MKLLKDKLILAIKNYRKKIAGIAESIRKIEFRSRIKTILPITKKFRLPALPQGQWSIAFVCMVLGVMLAVQFRTTQDIRSTVPYQRIEDLSDRLLQTEKERDSLLKNVQELKKSTSTETATREMELIKMSAGAVALEGPGIIVTIDDSKKISRPGENLNVYLIHDEDLLKVINDIRASGAEAISINDQRLIGTSEIRCAGTTISVNNTRCGPPYEIKAIGDQQVIENGLKMRGGQVEALQVWGIQLAIKREDKLRIPAYKGTFRFEIAKPVKEEK